MKILHSSFACDPDIGSECYVGWKWANMVSSKGYELHVLTRKLHYNAIEREDLSNSVKFHYFDLPGCSNLGHWHTLIKPYYVLWQIFVIPKLYLLQFKYRYKYVHHITYNNLDVPGFTWLLFKSKYIWGPVGGGQVPPASLKVIYGKRWWKQIARKWMKKFSIINPVVRLALYRSSMVLFANKDTYKLIGRFVKKPKFLLETAIDESRIKGKPESKIITSDEFKLLWVGRIEHRKALILALDALKLLVSEKCRKFTMDVVGDGPLLESMKLYSKSNGLESIVNFLGRIPFGQVDNCYQEANVFIFTSVQDTSGNVILEAMANALPVIGLNHQGVAEILKYGGGLLVDIDNYNKTVEGLANAITRYANDHEKLEVDSMNSLRIVQEYFTWSAKGNELESIYT